MWNRTKMHTNELVFKEQELVEERMLHYNQRHVQTARTDRYFWLFLADSMEGRKTACCGASARSVAMRVVFVGMIIVTGACLTITLLMVTRKMHTGNNRHTPGDRKSDGCRREVKQAALPLLSVCQLWSQPLCPAKRQNINLTWLEWAELTAPDHRPKYLWSVLSLLSEGYRKEVKTQAVRAQYITVWNTGLWLV